MAFPIVQRKEPEKEFSLTEIGIEGKIEPRMTKSSNIEKIEETTKANLSWSECEKDVRNIILDAAKQVGTIIEDPILLHWMTVDITRYIHNRFGLDPDLPEYKR